MNATQAKIQLIDLLEKLQCIRIINQEFSLEKLVECRAKHPDTFSGIVVEFLYASTSHCRYGLCTTASEADNCDCFDCG